MARIMVFQHVPYEPLGCLDGLIRSRKHRIRYVNFGREPDAKPDINGYDALIILGGPMNIGQEESFPHLVTEQQMIRTAMDKNIPVLGICLGAQLIAAACGAKVYPAESPEIGWHALRPTKQGMTDPVVGELPQSTEIFQWHGHTFDLPDQAELLVTGKTVKHQAFRIGRNVYGFQFHLEACLSLIQRWLTLPAHVDELATNPAVNSAEQIFRQSRKLVNQSMALSEQVFGQFLDLLPQVNKRHNFPHR